MKGLLLKDYYTLFKQARIFLLIIIVFAVMPGQSVQTMAVVYAALLPITALAYDERAKWDSLAAMMPIVVKDIVLSKYLLGYAGIIGASVLSIAGQAVIGAVRHTAFEPELLPSLILTACVSIVLLSINLPIMFKAGVEKGRIVFLLLLGAIGAVVLIMSEKLDNMLQIASANIGSVAIAAAAVTAVISIASICVSTTMYKHRAV